MALHRFHQRSPTSVSHEVSRFREKILRDNDPSVMSACLCALFDLVSADVQSYRDLTTSFVSILKQVVEHRLPKPYNYHSAPAPFIQIKLLKILAVLGTGDKKASNNMYSVLVDVLRKAEPSGNIGNALIYECISTITSIHPNTKLLESAAAHTSRFLKGYAISAITKICSFEIAAGKKVQLIPECQTFTDELSASLSTDLQQRAYEFQALLAFDSDIVGAVLPIDASCEDIEVDKNLPFLNNYVQSMLSKGAKRYIPQSERLEMGVPITWANQHDESAASANHSLRFDPYEKPQPPIMAITPVTTFESDDQRVERSGKEYYPPAYLQPSSDVDALIPEAGRLRLEGVQKKWGRPTYNSSSSASSSAGAERSTNGSAVPDTDRNSSSKERAVSQDKYTSNKSKQPELSAEKQKLAASLFGGVPSKSDPNVKASGKSQKQVAPNKHPTTGSKKHDTSPLVDSKKQASLPPPPDLLDFGEEEPSIASSRDPMKDLEGLLDLTDTGAPTEPAVTTTSQASTVDLMSLYETTSTGLVGGIAHNNNMMDLMANTAPGNILGDNMNVFDGLLASSEASAGINIPGQMATTLKKGPSLETSLQKHARSRQVGVTPTGPHPDLFKDLLK